MPKKKTVSILKIWRHRHEVDARDGLADSDEALKELMRLDLSDPKERAEELSKFPLVS
jgi:hypothetical protein